MHQQSLLGTGVLTYGARCAHCDHRYGDRIPEDGIVCDLDSEGWCHNHRLYCGHF